MSACLLAGCHTLASRGGFTACQAADAGTTLYALERGGNELNPLVGAILELAGPAGFIVAKLGVTLLVLHEYSRISSRVIAVASAATCGIAIHNAKVARRLQQER